MTRKVEWSPGRWVTARVVEGDRSPGVVLAHGAGVDQDHPHQLAVRDSLTEAGFGVVTFNYPYAETGSRLPDRTEVLLACHRAVLDTARVVFGTEVALVGRSMGGRMGTMLAAEGIEVAGVVALAYPLHPIGKPDKLRVDHLKSIPVPVLMVVGDRDPMCSMTLYDRHVRSLPSVTTVVIGDGDHSFRVRKRSGRTDAEARDEAIAAVVSFLGDLR